MITRVALKLGGIIIIGKEKERHDALYPDWVMNYITSQKDKGEQGFITHEGEFKDRREAGMHAYLCGQIKEPCLLVSEDIW